MVRVKWNTSLQFQHKIYSSQQGFTIIELLIVFAVLAILSMVSAVSFVTYNKTQTLSSAAKDIEQMLTLAKSRAQSQVKPEECGQNSTLIGYEFRICANEEVPDGVQCSTGGDYEVIAVCINAGQEEEVPSVPATNASPKKLPNGISIASLHDATPKVRFGVLTGGVTGAGNITLQSADESEKRIITIDERGNINVQ